MLRSNHAVWANGAAGTPPAKRVRATLAKTAPRKARLVTGIDDLLLGALSADDLID